MGLKKASRKRVKIKMQIGGASGSGKTMSSLFIAHGMCNDWSKICVIDTENDSSSLYEGVKGIGEFYQYTIKDFNPKNYIKAIQECEKEGIEVIIIDSTTHAWEWCKAKYAGMAGNSFQNWGVVLKDYDAFKNTMLQCDMHVISTVRKKEEMVLEEKDGKKEVVKKGLESIDRSNMTYEYTTVLDIDQISHEATCSKDRTGLFVDMNPTIITSEIGTKLRDWCLKSTVVEKEANLTTILDEIRNSKDLEELTFIYKKYKDDYSNNNDFIESVKYKKSQFVEQK